MAKNTDLFIAQQLLMKGWITPFQLSECMKVQKNSPASLGDLLLQKQFINKEQLASMEEIFKKRCVQNTIKVHCPDCSQDTMIEDYQPDEDYPCPHCKHDLPPPSSPFHEEEKHSHEKHSHEKDFSLIPKQIGHYKILSEIGRGGMGIVYKVKHPELDFPLALKVLIQYDKDKSEHAGENVMRFYREIELASKLRHPNIIGIHDVGAYNGCPYYTMDYVEGQTLDKVLKKKSPLPEKTAMEIIEKVAAGLACAHKAKIIHRDLKPANIILDQQNRVYLMDFGIAKCREKMFKDLTRTGTIMGTPDYMPPEQATGKTRLISFQSDVYSMGATLYYMLTGTPPFHGDSAIEVISNVIRGKPIAPRQLNPEISRQTEAIIMKALSYEIEDRYPNAGAFGMDVRTLLSGGKTMARPESRIKLFFRFLRRNALIISCFLITFIAVLVTVFLIVKAM